MSSLGSASMESGALGASVQRFREPASPTPTLQAMLRLDPLLLIAGVGLIACSVLMMSTATTDDIPGQPYYYVIRQAIYGGVGVVLMLLIARFDYSRMREWKLGIYGLMIGSIVLVFAVAGATRGSRRWIDFPFFNFQPSELGKVLLILALSAFVVDRVRRLGEWRTTSRMMLVALAPAMLVVAQPDLGSGLVYVVIATSILFVAGTKWTHFAALGVLAVAAVVVTLVVAPAVGVEVLKPYQVDRLTAFMNPSDNPQGQGYQLNQSQVAIGSGGKTGRGEAGATQTQLDFLPEHHTDFVFSVTGEAYGFVGAALILSLYALLIWRGLRILTMSKNLYGTLIAGGITAYLMFQVFVNVGMTIGIMPITGVPLPLMSYGGSSVLVTFMALGLLQSIHAQARETAVAKGRDTLI
jgi:rod shape determining protein RodA